ncbi:prolyl oligopeptidase family serine peptidase [Candidatus Berkiella aquae]|uniref:Esterase n=1 Tax=Candidatus Berkiella aquae TaxID=295108 RepID=A0A0Q9Z0X7_9GAMM|nr:S9 family peptidase [Candidatus Berkiella aquae]MCS5712629.1 S9 family peptidase [Candidatus Berkiella aquae]
MIFAPYGTWDSPISAQMASSAIVAFQDVVIDGNDIYWSEMRPNEGGRCVIVKQSSSIAQDILPKEFNARTRVHEYGGAAFTVDKGIIYFIHFADQRLYRMAPGTKPQPITQTGIRFADLKVTPFGIVAIAESHLAQTHEPENFLALIDPETGHIQPLAKGYDFYSSPALSKDFKQIAWICWNHPNMPWDNTELWIADFTQQGLQNQQRIDEKEPEQAFFQPQWGPHNELVVVSDKNNWWNLYQVKDKQLELLFQVDSEIGRPLWNFGASTWGFYRDGLLCTYADQGKGRLFFVKNNKPVALDLPFNNFSQLRIQNETVAFIGGHPQKPTAMVALLDLKTPRILRENSPFVIDEGYLSAPLHITYESTNNRVSHAYFYAPHNQNFAAKEALPPLIVKSHGGPTANCGADFNLDIQYWTSRGFAVVDVNYAGSTGYGRTYRKSLEQNWGIYDVQDCEKAAHYLVSQGLVNANQLAITGGSAGGYTTLAALAFTKSFQAGASLYGVSDCEALAKDTHKFEARYLDRLIGPYPQMRETYLERSPLYHVDKLSSPVIFFQGDEDKVVPVDQAEKMYFALQEKGIMTELYIFKGEQHGFRKAENRITVLEKMREFFLKAWK